ncbi:hypothetical protein Bbelb_077640 [Branchiostoma belcheri]|nr:hypothetical protein Bbelb_077640 [Branchiostoma belcheri]
MPESSLDGSPLPERRMSPVIVIIFGTAHPSKKLHGLVTVCKQRAPLQLLAGRTPCSWQDLPLIATYSLPHGTHCHPVFSGGQGVAPLPIEELQTTTYTHKTCTSDHPIQYPYPHRLVVSPYPQPETRLFDLLLASLRVLTATLLSVADREWRPCPLRSCRDVSVLLFLRIHSQKLDFSTSSTMLLASFLHSMIRSLHSLNKDIPANPLHPSSTAPSLPENIVKAKTLQAFKHAISTM